MKAHRTDLVSLTFSLLFLALTAWWVVAKVVDLPLPTAGWFLAGSLILLGTLGLVGALRSSRTAPTPLAGRPHTDEPESGSPEPDEAGPDGPGPGPQDEATRGDDRRP